MNWQDHGTHHSLYRGGVRVAQVRWISNVFECIAFSPDRQQINGLEVRLQQAKAWAEEATK